MTKKSTSQCLCCLLEKCAEERDPNNKEQGMYDTIQDICEAMQLPWPETFRTKRDIEEAAEEFSDKVWWNRHQILKERVEEGKETVDPKIWEMAKKHAEEIEKKYGRENLGWDDWEWGAVNGKLSALRWVMGTEWDFLDT